jgi:hypothetical protein
MQKKNEITCTTRYSLDWHDIKNLQQDLKTRNDVHLNGMKESILRNGFSFPFFVWNDGIDNWCLDGHGRLEALAMLESDGYSIPKLPITYIFAANRTEAKEKLLEVNIFNGDFIQEELKNVITELQNQSIDFSKYSFPNFDIQSIFSNDTDADNKSESDNSVPKESYSQEEVLIPLTTYDEQIQDALDFSHKCPVCLEPLSTKIVP